MSDAIQQIQASYHAIEDRILLKLRTDSEQFQAWITRRYLKMLIPGLQGLHPATGERILPEKDHQMQAISTAEATQTMDALKQFEQDYQAPENMVEPLGSAPLLLTKLSFKALESDNPSLVLEPEIGSGIALSFNPQIIAALLKIFEQAISASDWEIELIPIIDLPDQITLH